MTPLKSQTKNKPEAPATAKKSRAASETSPSSKNKKSGRMPRGAVGAIREALLQLLETHRGDLFKTNEISKMLAIPSSDDRYQELKQTIHQLEEEGAIIRGTRRRYGLAGTPDITTIEGSLTINNAGNGIVLPDPSFNLTDTILVKSKLLQNATEGSYVRVLLSGGKKKRPQGRVIEVLDPGTPPIPKKERIRENELLRKQRQQVRTIVNLDERLEAMNNRDSPTRHAGKRIPWHEAEAFSYPDERDKLIEEMGLPREFPKEVLDEAKQLPTTISTAEIAERLDLRGKTIFTIDPEDAKDFDDAVSLEENSDGSYTLGVHIADVSHFVQEGTALDDEALARSTSIYLAGTVIPMLPEAISNELCSLRPDEDKLAYSVFMRIDPKSAEVLSSEFRKTIIRSVFRFSYEEAEERTKSGRGKHAKLLRQMRKLSERMYAARREEGSIDFETSEVRFRFDEEGNPIESYQKPRLGSMRMIEDFMLAANRAVAEYIGRHSSKGATKPFLYRIHADPDPEKLKDVALLAKSLGYKFETQNASPKTVQTFLESIKGVPEEKMLNQLVLRAMAKAVYAEENVGHFGLAFLHYTHFTSPIRRYPDLIIHRMLHEYLTHKGKTTKLEQHYFSILPDIADLTSALERRAVEGERESSKLAQLFLMRDHIGEEFDAVITGVVPFGIFVALPNGAEGLLHIKELPGHYTYDEELHQLRKSKQLRRGGQSGHVPKRQLGKPQRGSGKQQRDKLDLLRLGETIRVQLIRVKIDRREMDFKLAEEQF